MKFMTYFSKSEPADVSVITVLFSVLFRKVPF